MLPLRTWAVLIWEKKPLVRLIHTISPQLAPSFPPSCVQRQFWDVSVSFCRLVGDQCLVLQGATGPQQSKGCTQVCSEHSPQLWNTWVWFCHNTLRLSHSFLNHLPEVVHNASYSPCRYWKETNELWWIVHWALLNPYYQRQSKCLNDLFQNLLHVDQ